MKLLFKKGKEMKFKEFRQASGMSVAQTSRYFEIPYRTVQNWEYGVVDCPEYLMKLMEYKLNNENEREGH